MSNTDFVPAWAKRAVWYQIFPDRFHNGDPANDPTLESLQFSYPHDYAFPWRLHPWTSDWYELQAYERACGLDLWQNLQRRRYGGDLQGVLDKLDYLQDLGVDALYLNPVFDAASLHKYDGNTYHHIDVHLGPDPLGDRRLIAGETPDDPRTWVWTAADRLMLKLIAEVHRRGMRLVFDGVFNHLGLGAWPFRDLVAKGRASRFKDWFKILDWDKPSRFAPFTYSGWAGVPELPEFNQDAHGHVAGPKDYIFACTRRWMDPASAPGGAPAELAEGGGIDGWRLDVAFCIRHGFWKDWRRHVKAINPDAYLVAEIVLEDADEPYLQGDEFDAVMHYRWAFACAEFFAETRQKSPASAFDQELKRLRAAHPAGVAHAQFNLLDSHDTARLASLIVNRRQSRYRDWKEHHPRSQVSNNPAYATRRPTADERALLKLMVLFQMTDIGAPVVYYGDEAGMWGANDPCCRKPMVWPELTYAPEAALPDGSRRAAPDPVAFDHDLHAYYRRLIHLRRGSAALQLGDFQTLLADDAAGVLAFQRVYEDERLAVVINNNVIGQPVTLALSGRWVDVLNGDRVYSAEAAGLTVDAPALSGCVLKQLG